MNTTTELFEIEQYDADTMGVSNGGKRAEMAEAKMAKIRNTYNLLKVGETFQVPKSECSHTFIRRELKAELTSKEVRLRPIGANNYKAGHIGTRVIKRK